MGVPLLQAVYRCKSVRSKEECITTYEAVSEQCGWGTRGYPRLCLGVEVRAWGTGGTQNKESHTMKSLNEVTPRIQSVKYNNHTLNKEDFRSVNFKE